MLRTLACMVIVPALATLLGACDKLTHRHEIVRAANQTFVLNKYSGEVKVVEGTTLVAVKSPQTNSMPLKVWPSQQLAAVGDIKVSIRTKFRDGQMLYIVNASPYEGVLQKLSAQSFGNAQLSFSLVDADGFDIGNDVQLPLSSGTRVVDDKGVPAQLQWEGARPMTLTTYLESTSINMGWNGFPADAKEK